MKTIFESRRFILTEVQRSGKKQIAGNLVLQGLNSKRGSGNWILAAKSGKVIATDRDADRNRDSHYGTFIRLLTDDDDPCEITYYRLTARFTARGDHVTADDKIAFVNDGILHIECRRNGRLIDAPAEFNIPPIVGREWGKE